MHTTPVSLLERLRKPDPKEAWERFVNLYTPLLYHWARKVGLRGEEADDLVHDVFVLLLERLPQFKYDPDQSFRSWLKTVTINKWKEKRRRRAFASLDANAALHDGLACSESDPFWEVEYRQHLVGLALEVMQAEFQPTTWKACWEHAVSGRSAAEVGAELGITEGAVYQAKCRVLRRLREELDGLFD